MNWCYKEPGCLPNDERYHWSSVCQAQYCAPRRDQSGAGGPIGYCRLHPPSPTSAIRERLNGILRCAAWRFLRLSFEFSLRARSSAPSRYTLKTIERLVFSAALHFFSVNFPALEVKIPNDPSRPRESWVRPWYRGSRPGSG
jgi:hypothetical protein